MGGGAPYTFKRQRMPFEKPGCKHRDIHVAWIRAVGLSGKKKHGEVNLLARDNL